MFGSTKIKGEKKRRKRKVKTNVMMMKSTLIRSTSVSLTDEQQSIHVNVVIIPHR